jgi:hypothetical protein
MHVLKWLPILAMFVAMSAHAMSGNEYRKLPPEQRLTWIVGVTDGLMTEQLFATGKKPEMADCFAKLEWEQVRAIFDKANESQPERWGAPAAFLFRQMFLAFCKSQ